MVRNHHLHAHEQTAIVSEHIGQQAFEGTQITGADGGRHSNRQGFVTAD